MKPSNLLKTLTKEEYESAPAVSQDQIRVALEKGQRDLDKARQSARKPRGRY